MIIIYMFTRSSFLGTCYIGDSKCFFLVSRLVSSRATHSLIPFPLSPFPFPLVLFPTPSSFSSLLFKLSPPILVTFVSLLCKCTPGALCAPRHSSIHHPSPVTRWLLPVPRTRFRFRFRICVLYPLTLTLFLPPSSARKERKEGKREKGGKGKGRMKPEGRGVVYKCRWLLWTFEFESEHLNLNRTSLNVNLWNCGLILVDLWILLVYSSTRSISYKIAFLHTCTVCTHLHIIQLVGN